MARRWGILVCAFVLTLNVGWTTAKKKSVLDYDEKDVQRVYKEWLVSVVSYAVYGTSAACALLRAMTTPSSGK